MYDGNTVIKKKGLGNKEQLPIMILKTVKVKQNNALTKMHMKTVSRNWL